jgi:two-component system response regulator GlrR
VLRCTSEKDNLLAIILTPDNFEVVPRQIKDQSIVVVEDDPYIAGALDAFLGDKNIVQTFGSAEEALEAEDHFRGVGVFIIDYKLPGKDGIELFKHLQASFPAAKFILITGEMSYDMVESTRNLGIDALMLKPFDARILEDNISGLLSLAG